jgi:hypothetical protein
MQLEMEIKAIKTVDRLIKLFLVFVFIYFYLSKLFLLSK